ncbi:hypothetical protein DVH24_022061 [Malus domestica]|uniref:Serpin domain-containing protein n=1 Tax=Malus domestica TaxID=3750 RepID=A0A498ITP5_MALDO|nr:hypothetical protein DVH24_022061 [Malus domestica]
MGWTQPKTRLEFNRHYIVHLVGAARDNRFSTQQQPTPFPLTTQMAPDPFPFILPDGDTKSTKETISNITDVSLEITKQREEMVYSPLSIQIVLWLSTAGSKGSTKKQLLSFLKFKSVDQLSSLASHLIPLVFADGSARGGPCLCFANGLWVNKSFPIKPSFKDVVDTAYKVGIKHVSFQNTEKARREMNLWAKKATKGLITEALPPGSIKKKTMLIISNALCFKGHWSDKCWGLKRLHYFEDVYLIKENTRLPFNNKFKASKTKEFAFHLLNRTCVKVPFMRSSENQFVESFDGFKVLKLRYAQGEDKERQFSMFLVLPNARYGLLSLVKRVCFEPSFLDRHHLESQVPVADIKIPRFKITSNFTAYEIPEDLELVLPFNGEGDLTKMVESSPEGAAMFHKSFIEVDEEGTEAAAVSSYLGWSLSRGIKRPRRKLIDFVADHPFMFFYHEGKDWNSFVHWSRSQSARRMIYH